MFTWECIQQTLDYIEAHIGEELPVAALADLANLSPFYYQRLFSRLVKRPLREYIKLRRLANACEPLKDTKRRILDVALEAGFQSHESFTRAFKEAYGMTPEQYRDSPVMLNQFDKPDLLLKYTIADEGVPLVSDGLVLEMNWRRLASPVTFMGVAGYVPIEGQMPLGEGTGVDLPGEIWERFHSEKHLIPRLPNGRELGVAYLGDAPKGSFTYFAGAEVASGAEDTRFLTWALPKRDYVVCGFEAENFLELTTVAINKAVNYCGIWLSRHGLTQKLYSPELYYGSDPEASYMELWIPAEKT